MVRKLVYSVLTISVLMAVMSFTAPGYGRLTIRFENYVGDKVLVLDSVNYKNPLEQSYTVSMFKYYVGNFHLKNSQEKEFISKGYFLINEEDKNSMQIKIDSVPYGVYNSISFTLGVDSIDNCTGAQTGALDPVNGMYWAWNSGYIFLKMEGQSPSSNSTGKRLEFHIGGYKTPNNCVKKIHILIDDYLVIGEKMGNKLKIRADLNSLFFSPNPVDFSKSSSVTDFHNAKKIANNYSSMFRIINYGNY